MSTLINPIIETGPDYCYACETPHVVEIYNVYDKPLGLASLLNFKTDIANASKVALTKARCKNCGHKYIICWDSNGRPYTMDEPFKIDCFVEKFHDYKVKGDLDI